MDVKQVKVGTFCNSDCNKMITCWSSVPRSSSLSFWFIPEELVMCRKREEGCMRGRYGLSSES